MRTIAIMNNKGGVGKTVTAINLADILAREHNRRVVLVDCDGQMNLTRFFAPGFDPLESLSVASILRGDGEPVWSDNLFPICEGLSMLPGSSELYGLDLRAIRDGGYDDAWKMRHFCDTAREDGDVDYIIFDCPPGFTAASVAALLAADDVVIPMTLDGFSFTGMQDMQLQIASLQHARVGIRIAGILVTQWHNSQVVRESEQLLRSLRVPVFQTVIRRTEKVPESTFDRTPVAQYSPSSAAARDYRLWVQEYLREV